MKLLGEWNWYLPSWLEWLPEVENEGSLLHPDEIEFGELRPGVGEREPAKR